MPYELPSWMQAEAPSEPWKALVSGVQAGSGIASNILRSRAVSEERRQFDIQAERQVRMDALATKLQEQHAQLNEIRITNEIRSRQEQIDSEVAYNKVATRYSYQKSIGIAGTDAAEGAIGELIANNGNFWLHPGAKDLAADMFVARKVRDVAEQRKADAAAYQIRVETQQAGQSQRKMWDVNTREYVAETRSDAQIEAARIRAEADVQRATIGAEKWKDHSRFTAFKDASAAIRDRINPVREPERYAEAIRDIYTKLLPTGETNAWDSTIAPAGLAPADPMPKSKEEFDALPPGAWFINPADGKRMRKR